MKLYIIVPVYNAEKYIFEAIDSIVSEMENLKCSLNILLVDDGSSDDSSKICMLFEEKYPEIIYLHQENQGVSIARNLGLTYVFNKCKGNDLIGFLDADDVWIKGWTSIINTVMDYEDDVIGFGMQIVNDNLKVQQRIVLKENILDGGVDTSIKENRKIHFGAYLYKAVFLKKWNILFPPKVKNGEDLMFKYKAFFVAKRIKYLEKELYVYRKNEYSVTSNYSQIALEHYSDFFLAWNELMQWIEHNSFFESDKAKQFVKEKINCSCMYAAINYCRWHNGSYKMFIKNIVNELFFTNLISPVVFTKGNLKLKKEYDLLSSHSFIFYLKYHIDGTFFNFKKRIKTLFKINKIHK